MSDFFIKTPRGPNWSSKKYHVTRFVYNFECITSEKGLIAVRSLFQLLPLSKLMDIFIIEIVTFLTFSRPVYVYLY